MPPRDGGGIQLGYHSAPFPAVTDARILCNFSAVAPWRNGGGRNSRFRDPAAVAGEEPRAAPLGKGLWQRVVLLPSGLRLRQDCACARFAPTPRRTQCSGISPVPGCEPRACWDSVFPSPGPHPSGGPRPKTEGACYWPAALRLRLGPWFRPDSGLAAD